MTTQVVFIHSLFRSGSTYLFNVFRRAGTGFWCYQEPLHDAVYFMRSKPEALLEFNSDSSKKLRHSELDKPYFQELYDVRDVWPDLITKEAIYDQYFVQGEDDKSIPFFRALIEAAKAVPVIQECRTSCRINSLKDALHGTHIYLWRNPWDQWWSYQVNDYFDAVTMLILNADIHPREIAAFRDKIQLQKFDARNIHDQVDHFKLCPLDSSNSYQAFYLLWCLGLREGLRYADVVVNIDKLSDDVAYRKQISEQLDSRGLHGCDFADCKIPQTVYAAQDEEFFREQEAQIHHILITSGWSQQELEQLQELRDQFMPKPLISNSVTEKNVMRDAERSRSLARRFMDQRANRMPETQARLLMLQQKVDKLGHSADYWLRVSNEHALELSLIKTKGIFAKIKRILLMFTKLQRRVTG